MWVEASVHNVNLPGGGTDSGGERLHGSLPHHLAAYHGNPVSVPVGLSASDFDSFDRGGGVLQSTFKGWLVYTYLGDAVAGDVNGDGTGGKWFATKIPFTAPQ